MLTCVLFPNYVFICAHKHEKKYAPRQLASVEENNFLYKKINRNSSKLWKQPQLEKTRQLLKSDLDVTRNVIINFNK